MKVPFRNHYLIWIIIAFSLACIITGAVLQNNAEKTIRKSQQTNSNAIQAYTIHQEIQSVITDAITIESKIRGYIITGDALFLTGVQDTMVNLKIELATLTRLAQTESNRQVFTQLAALIDQKIRISNDLLNIYGTKGKTAAEAAIATREGSNINARIVQLAITIQQQLQQEFATTLQQNNARAARVLLVSRILTFLSIGVTVFLCILVIYRLQKQWFLIDQLEQANSKESEARRNIEKISAEIRDLYNNAPCGYHSIDSNGYFTAINDTELNWLEYTREEMVGKIKFGQVVDKAGLELFRLKFEEFKKKGEVKELRFNMISKSGRHFPVLLNSRAIYDAQGNYLSSRSTLFDITEQQKNEAELQVAKQQAIESALVKEQFLANMSHEIRTPINSVIGFTNLLQKTALSSEQQQFVHLVQSASENLLSIINDILDISKIEAGMLRIEKNPFSLRGLCNSVETMFHHKAREKSLSFSLNIQENIPDTLTGDAVRLTQILVNLISNAIKFTQEGSITINITQQPPHTPANIRLLFSVKDTGIGIPADKLESIFERFQQGETDTTRKYGGTGLGLSIVRNLVQLQNGTIRVKSNTNEGTEFLFELEYEQISAGTGMNGTMLYTADVPENGSLSLKGIKILVVEDNHMNQLLIRHTFGQWQLSFELAENGQVALEWLRKEPFDLVLLDIQMPVMDGYVTARAIRHELKSNMPIIAMTAHALAGEREKCLTNGMNDYISKPIHERELFNLIRKYVSPKTQTMEHMKANFQFIDLAFLDDLVMGSTEFMKNIIQQLLKQFPGEMEALKEAVHRKDNKQVATFAHHMQSTVSVLGKNTPFFQQLEKLELLAKTKSKVPVLTTEFDKLYHYKNSLLSEITQLLEN